MLRLIDELKAGSGLPAKAICATVNLPYQSYCRWLVRSRLSLPLVQVAGPKKVAPFDPSELQNDIRTLEHRRKLSYGSPKIYEKYAFSLSQRALAELVRHARADMNREYRQNMKRVEWLVPGMVWSMDSCELAHENIIGAQKSHFQQLGDLATRYRFDPIGKAYEPCGEEIAGHLARMFHVHGAPLFLKRDNGSNQNHAAVNGVLAEYMVIPLNSPVEYPPYNGAVEEAQKELKECLQQRLAISPCLISAIETCSHAAVNEINHRPRPCLNGKPACLAFFGQGERKRFTKRERGIVYDWLTKTKKDILSCMENRERISAHQAAWRMAVESWLHKNGYIEIKLNGKVSPYFLSENYHN